MKKRNVIINTIKHFIKAMGYDDYFNAMTFKELKVSSLREYLKYDDRNSMAFGIEARVPFLDYRIVEFAFSIKNEFKINNFSNKKLERDYAKELIPDSIYQRKDKMGFVSPQEIWQRKWLRPGLDKTFTNIGFLSEFYPAQKYNKISAYFKDYLKEKNDDWSYIWRIHSLYNWMKLNQLI